MAASKAIKWIIERRIYGRKSNLFSFPNSFPTKFPLVYHLRFQRKVGADGPIYPAVLLRLENLQFWLGPRGPNREQNLVTSRPKREALSVCDDAKGRDTGDTFQTWSACWGPSGQTICTKSRRGLNTIEILRCMIELASISSLEQCLRLFSLLTSVLLRELKRKARGLINNKFKVPS